MKNTQSKVHKMSNWKNTLVQMKKEKQFTWQFLKRANKFLTALEECGAEECFISKVNGNIKFQMPQQAVARDVIFSHIEI